MPLLTIFWRTTRWLQRSSRSSGKHNRLDTVGVGGNYSLLLSSSIAKARCGISRETGLTKYLEDSTQCMLCDQSVFPLKGVWNMGIVLVTSAWSHPQYNSPSCSLTLSHAFPAVILIRPVCFLPLYQLHNTINWCKKTNAHIPSVWCLVSPAAKSTLATFYCCWWWVLIMMPFLEPIKFHSISR